jgi:hypothetical protein
MTARIAGGIALYFLMGKRAGGHRTAPIVAEEKST